MGAFVGALASGLGMGVAGKLFGSPKQGAPQTTTQSYQMAPWEEDYWKQMTSRAEQLANQPYQAYTGQRVAGLTNPQEQAVHNAVSTSHNWETPFNAAQGEYGQALSPFGEHSLDPYMSPYIGNVVGNIERIGNENFSAPGGVADTITSDFTGLGQYGSKRMGDVMNRAGQLNERETMGQVSNALQAGYGQAANMYNADKSRELWGAGGLSSLAGQEQALENGTTNALMNAGNVEQQQAQRELDVPYQNYLEGRDWNMNRLMQASSVGRGMPGAGTSTTTSPGPYMPSNLQNFLGGVGLYEGLSQNGMLPSFSSGATTAAPAMPEAGMINGIPTGTYAANPLVPYEWSGSPFKRGGLVALKRGGWIKGAIRHPGALHRELGVPLGSRIPAKKLHAAAQRGGALGRRARLAETLESFHHADGGRIGYAKGGTLKHMRRPSRGALASLAY